jgi:hypothetical protein
MVIFPQLPGMRSIAGNRPQESHGPHTRDHGEEDAACFPHPTKITPAAAMPGSPDSGNSRGNSLRHGKKLIFRILLHRKLFHAIKSIVQLRRRRKFTWPLQREGASDTVSAVNGYLTNKNREMMYHGCPPSCSFPDLCPDFSSSPFRECLRIGA